MMYRRSALAIALSMIFAVLCALPQAADAKITKEMIEEFRPEIESGLTAKDPLQRAHAILAAGMLDDRKLNKELEPFLENTNREIRHAAIVALGSNKDKKALKALDDEMAKDPAGRYLFLAEILPRLPEKVQVDLLKKMITGRKVDAKVQKDALRYISEYDQGKVYGLMVEVTKAKKAEERKPYSDVLLSTPRPEAFGWAEKLYTNKKDAEARRLGLELAIKIGGKKVDGMARKALTDADPAIVKMGLDYLSERKDPSATDALLKQLKVATDDARKIELIERVLAIGHKVPLAQAAQLLDSEPESVELQRAYHRLFGATKKADAIERLQKQEQSTNIGERRNAIVGLSWTDSKVAVQILTRTLYDGDDEVGLLSVVGLGVLADPSTVKDLQGAFNKARDKERKREIVRSIGQIKSDDAANALVFLVRDRDTEVKKLAIDGLANIRSKKSSSVLDILIRDTNPAIRFKATLLQLQLDKKAGFAILGKALERPPSDYMEQIDSLPSELRDEVLLSLLKNESAKLRSDAWDAVLLLDREGLTLVRIAAAETYPKDIKDQAIDLLSARNDAVDTGLFKLLAQTGNADQKLLAMRWLIRRAGGDLAGFFRTLMNGFKADRPMRAVALYGLLKSSS